MRHVCRYCGNTVELRPQYDADAPKRWVHLSSLDYRCLLFADPYAPFGVPVEVPTTTTRSGR